MGSFGLAGAEPRACYNPAMAEIVPPSHPDALRESHSAALRADRVAMAALFLGAVCIAFAPIFVRLSEAGPSATAFYRFALALPFLWLWLSVTPQNKPGGKKIPRRPAEFAKLGLAGLFFAGDMGFWHWSITYTSVANATLLANTAPVFVVLGGWLIFGRRFRKQFLLGLLLAMGGTAILMNASFSLGGRHLTGDLLGVVTGFFYGAYFLTVERLRRDYSTAAIMSCAIPVSALVMLVVSLASGEALLGFTWQGWAVLLGLAIVSQVCGQSLIAFGLAQLPASFASVSLLVQPMLAALFAWILLSEPLGALQGVGGVIVLTGIWLARRGSMASSGGGSMARQEDASP